MISKPTTSDGTWKACELRKLPSNERDAILESAAVQAENEYRTNAPLTDFEAFGEDDLHGESTAATAIVAAEL
jgi:hypothetical protein